MGDRKRRPYQMDPVRKTIAENLLREVVEATTLRWYYISVATETEFLGGYFIQARGPTEAWMLLHALGWYPCGSEASTETIEILDEEMETKVPANMRWRKLTKKEVEGL